MRSGIRHLRHTTGPETERIAIRKLKESGQHEKLWQMAIRLVGERPGCTALELLEFATPGTLEYSLRPRLSELKDEGLILAGKIRKCRVRGSSMETYYPVRAKESQGQLFTKGT